MVSVPHVDELFPTAVAFASTGGSKWKTAVVEFGGGGEQRTQEWDQSKADFDIVYGIHEPPLVQAVMKFQEARRGMAQSFNFKWHEDFEVFNMPLQEVSVEGGSAIYQLVKEYFDGPFIWQPNTAYQVGDRVIPTLYAGQVFVAINTGLSGGTEPTWNAATGSLTVDNTIKWTCLIGPEVYIKTIEKVAVGSLTIRIADVPQDESTAYTVNYSRGIVTFPFVPAVTPRADFEFYRKVRLGEDGIQVQQEGRNAWLIRSIPLVEQRPEDA